MGSPPLVRLDLDRSTLALAGRTFPAVCLRCPSAPGEAEDSTPFDRVLGGVSRGNIEVYIPLESGVLINVSDQTFSQGVLSLTCWARICEFSPGWMNDPPIWLPMSLGLGWNKRTLVPGWISWGNCDPDWAVEQIDRLSTFAYREPDNGNPHVEVLPLREGYYFPDTKDVCGAGAA